VLPLWPEDRVWAFCEQVCGQIAALGESYPFVPLPTVAAATVTRDRPLPIDRLRRQAENGLLTA
jgi:hypothetical protein